MRLTKKLDLYDTPPGIYDARFAGVREIDQAQFKNASAYESDGGPRLQFTFEVVNGPAKGKIVQQTTGTNATPKSRLREILIGLSGGRVTEDVEIDIDSFVGCLYRVGWQVNPNSTSGNCHVASLFPLNGQGGGAAPVPPAARPGRRYWVSISPDHDELWSEEKIQKEIDRGHSADLLQLCAAADNGDAVGAWKSAKEFGFAPAPKEDNIPF
jgi:hypothetical protein